MVGSQLPITVFLQRGFSFTIDSHLEHWGKALRGRITVRDYQRALGPVYPVKIKFARKFRRRIRKRVSEARVGWIRSFPRAVNGRIYIFSDIERLSVPDRDRAGALHATLSGDPATRLVLNDPRRSLCRYELLRTLHDLGENDFNVYRVTERQMPERFPVFLRGEYDHDGAATELIESPEALTRELATMTERGILREGKLIVEFVDTRSDDGLFRKYGAFRIGDRIVPRHVLLSKDWMIKSSTMNGLTPEVLMAEQMAYFEDNPHEGALRRIFELANIEYGRIDYGLTGGRIQVFEINTNPMVVSRRNRTDARAAAHEHFAVSYRKALDALGHGG